MPGEILEEFMEKTIPQERPEEILRELLGWITGGN